MSKPIRLILVDDHVVVRSGLKAVLQHSPRLEVVGEASNGAEALQVCARLAPDVVLLDMRLGRESGAAVCRRLKDLRPAPRVLVLTSYADDELVIEALAAGADGYLLKHIDGDELIKGVEQVAVGGAVLDPGVMRRVLDRMKKPRAGPRRNSLRDLGPRELEVLKLVAEGNSNKEISRSLRITEGTVRNYLTTIFLKLGVNRRTQAAAVYTQSVKAEAD